MTSTPTTGLPGAPITIEGTALANIPVVVNTGGRANIVNEAHTRFVWDGKTGYGVSEFMEQLVG